MIVVTVFLFILFQLEFHLVEIERENCHHDHIPLYDGSKSFRAVLDILEKQHRSGVTLGIMGGQLKAPLKPLGSSQCYRI